MNNTEYTEKGFQSYEEQTYLDRDIDVKDYSVTMRGSGEGSQRHAASRAEEDGLTLCGAHAHSQRDLDETVGVRDVYKPVRRSPAIKRLFTGEEVLITKPVFCIGRKEDADYAISMNVAISRKHAEIIIRDGTFIVRDLGAKNRTYVNGKPIPMNGEAKLVNGDVIKLANEDFLFICEGV